jgi:hypothetical protein
VLNANLNWSSAGGSRIDMVLFVTKMTNNKRPISMYLTLQSLGLDGIVTEKPQIYGIRSKYFVDCQIIAVTRAVRDRIGLFSSSQIKPAG